MERSSSLAGRLSTPVERSLGKQAGRGAAWTTAQSLVNRGTQFLVFLVLARLLVPEDFGTLAAANVFVALTSVLADAGVARTLIQRPTLEARHLNAAFVMSLLSGGVLTLVLVAIAPVAARLYGIEDLTPILAALSVVPLVTALSSTAQSVLRRQLRFRAVVLRNIASTTVGGAVGVGAAVAGAGAWALVLLSVSQAVVSGVLIWVAAGWVPGLRTDREALKEIFGFSNRVLAIALANFVGRRGPELLLGVFLGPVALGIYTVATRVQSLLLDVSVLNISKVALPVLSRISDDIERLGAAYLRATRMTATVSFPFFAVMVLTGPQLVPTLFGSQWDRAGTVMAILALAGPLQSQAFFTATVFLATGRATLAMRWSVATTLASLVAFAVGVQLGIVAVAIASTVATYVMTPIGLALVRRVCGLRLRQQVAAFTGPLLGGVVVAAVVAVAHAVPVPHGAAWLVVTDLLAFVGYVATIAVLRRDLLAEVLSALGRDKQKRAPGGLHAGERRSTSPQAGS